MKRDRFAKPVAPPCEQWQQWAKDALRSTGNLMHTLPIDSYTEQHMTVELPPDPLPPVLQQYPLLRTEKSVRGGGGGGLLDDCESDDGEDDEDFLDNFTLLAILESQKETPTTSQKTNTSSKGRSVYETKKSDKKSSQHCVTITIDSSSSMKSPVLGTRKGDLLKSVRDSPIFTVKPVCKYNEVQRED